MARTHFKRGEQLAATNHLQDAVEEYRKALLFSPDNTAYRISLVNALIADRRFDEAQAHLEQLLQEDPTNGLLNLMLARVASLRGRTKQAIGDYERAVYEYWPASEVPERRSARWELIDLLGKAGRRNEAVGELMQLYANTPTDVEQKQKIGFMLLSYGATSEALRVFQDLLRIAPNDAQTHRGLAEAYFSSGDYVAARHEFQHALRFDPHDRQSVEGLTLDKAVIDLDPELANIAAAERLRRSENLLRRVLTDIDQCAGGPSTDPRVDNAWKLLDAKHAASADPGLAMQQAASEIWTQRSQLCTKTPATDHAVETVLARIGQ